MSTRPEVAHLLAILRSVPNAPDPDVPPTPDWDALLALAARTEILPMLAHHARHLPPAQQPPTAIAQRLLTAYLHAGVSNARILHEYRTIAKALEDKNLAWMPLKGVRLAALIYSDPALRPMGDIDLLVPREHVEVVGQVLQAFGYERFGPSLRDMPSLYHEKYQRIGQTLVELHWHLGQRDDQRARPVDMAGVWARAIDVEIDGVVSRALAPTDAFLYTCLHIYSHGFRVGLRRLLDLRALAHAMPEALDPHTLWARAADWRITRPVAVLCEIVREWLHVEIPAVPVPRDPAFVAAVRAAREDLLTIEGDDCADHVARFFGKGEWQQRSGVAARQLFPPRVEMAARYGKTADTPALYGLYAMRVLTALWKYGPFSATRRAARLRARFLHWIDAE